MKWEGLFGITSGRFAASAALAAFGMLGSLFAYAVGGSWTVCDSGRFAIESASFGVSFFVFAALLYSPVVVVLVLPLAAILGFSGSTPRSRRIQVLAVLGLIATVFVASAAYGASVPAIHCEIGM
jgi:hypothetical protein